MYLPTIGSKTHRVPKVVDADRLVSDDAGDDNVDHEDSTPDHVRCRCTVKERKNLQFVIAKFLLIEEQTFWIP